jgi:hypothetical protein
VSAVAGREHARAYSVAERFATGELLEHPTFGLGVVSTATDKIEVVFRDGTRTLVHGRAR